MTRMVWPLSTRRLQAVDEAGDVGQVETGGGRVEDVEDVVAAARMDCRRSVMDRSR